MTVVLHGHAHHGAPEGRTKSNTPVYNVSMPLLRQVYKDQPPVRLLEVPVNPAPPADGQAGDRAEAAPAAR